MADLHCTFVSRREREGRGMTRRNGVVRGASYEEGIVKKPDIGFDTDGAYCDSFLITGVSIKKKP